MGTARKKYFFLRVLTVTHGHIGQTFNALLSGISSSDMIVPIRAQKVFLFALLQMSPDETGIPARPQRYSIGLHTKSMRLNYSFRDAGSKKPLRKAIKRNKN